MAVFAESLAQGDITGVTAGTGLSGGGTSGTVTLSLSSPVSPALGGTGVINNTASTLTISGNYATTLTVTGTTGVTLPTAGTLLPSNPAGVTGADTITNIMSLTQAEYDAISPNASTLYVIVG